MVELKANGAARKRASARTPDGGQLLLLAGFLLAGAAIVAIGTLQIVERTETQVLTAERTGMVDMFFNARNRATTFFQSIVAEDTALSVPALLDDYMASQHINARQLSLELNATLASAGSLAPNDEAAHVSGGDYAKPGGGTLCATGGSPCYTGIAYDGQNDGLITDVNGRVLAAIFWLEVRGPDGVIFETIIIDVPSTNPN